MTPETITLPAALSIRGISAIHESLVSAFADHTAIVLDIPEDATVDLSFIQLVESSRRHAREQGKFITLKKPATPGVVETLQRGGFLANMDEASRLFWLHGKEIQ
ncbi:STAS domain-containing protein [Agrobacterium larrymoorei]|uniref:STAS domain-containing protein n=1 Tax=Agrobacterium larrymoorei TaxID=160699 RepID=A0A4D7DX30_9HYPH|nr:STAS domain-containing protein [Agrobacterium larrymoorei]QCI99754.1 STAS domain-containing protein [Agrobacterium larrymoorei]QYA09811.1 STAS domain-containing protein [Agrobacterium larrymoorei]WHA42749.1 STAS domain-containing protein [Agrobacterium larrymoorei]